MKRSLRIPCSTLTCGMSFTTMLFIRRILHLNNSFCSPCGHKQYDYKCYGCVTGCTLGSCASVDRIDLVSGKMPSEAEETFMKSSPPVKFISKVMLTEPEFFSQKLCKQIVNNLFKYIVKYVLVFACKCVIVAYM